MLENVAMAGYNAPTPIQRYTLPAVRDGQDIVAIAQTGQYFRYQTVFKNSLTLPLIRLWQDRRLPDPYPQQADGQGQEARGSASEPR
jgi:hypothetical protein